ncbi:MAG: hypothetical protein ACPHJ3_15525, partial [Rubripirellula sp.]
YEIGPSETLRRAPFRPILGKQGSRGQARNQHCSPNQGVTSQKSLRRLSQSRPHHDSPGRYQVRLLEFAASVRPAA